jgi:hypothetical protein
MLRFKNFGSASRTLSGIEMVRIINFISLDATEPGIIFVVGILFR